MKNSNFQKFQNCKKIGLIKQIIILEYMVATSTVILFMAVMLAIPYILCYSIICTLKQINWKALLEN